MYFSRNSRDCMSSDFSVVDPTEIEREAFPESGNRHRKLTAPLDCTEMRINMVTLEPGEATAPHSHERQEEYTLPWTVDTLRSTTERSRFPLAESSESRPSPSEAFTTTPKPSVSAGSCSGHRRWVRSAISASTSSRKRTGVGIPDTLGQPFGQRFDLDEVSGFQP